jgi:hypothetical protein
MRREEQKETKEEREGDRKVSVIVWTVRQKMLR